MAGFSCSKHFFFLSLPLSLQVGGEMERGQERWESRSGKKKRKKEEKAFNLFTVTVLRWFQQNAEYFSVSQGPDFVHRAARATGSQQTLIAPKPKAAPFKQGHSSSHRKGNGLWP